MSKNNTMKVVGYDDEELVFDNGLRIVGSGDIDCCAVNYIDFSGFSVGDEFEAMTAEQASTAIKIKDGGFILKDKSGIPKWGQARSEQNGYYSAITTLYVQDKASVINLGKIEAEISYC